ncbi:MAG: phosphate transport system regulatory protein PhoU [Gloeocapsa sp. DLM2.Bin57]|nr:MAG: phosphate transport system regulatory protein PhoU [Gloeocapsa sp. DLM2.Bin57]
MINPYYRKTSTVATPLERCLRRVEQDVLRMGSLVEQSFRLSHQCLFEGYLDAAEQIIKLDKEIDAYYRKIELDCALIMTTQAPLAQDLRILTASMQLVRDLERIGDYAQDLTEIAIKLLSYPPHPLLGEIKQMSYHAQFMLSTSLSALASLDAATGLGVKQLDDVVDDAYELLYQQLAYQEIRGCVEPILLLTLTIRHLERMADHSTNIGQRVNYIVTGYRG